MTQQEYSPYAPVRMRELHWWTYAKNVSREGRVTPAGMIASDLPDKIFNELVVPLTKLAAKSFKGKEDEGAIGQMIAKVMSFRQWVPLIAQYEGCGKQIFDLEDGLVQMLRLTDAEDCQLSQWQAPFDSFYVRFGKQLDMRLEFGGEGQYEYLDGAFVAVTPWKNDGEERRLKIGLCTVKEDGSGVQMPGYFVDLTPDEQKLPPSEAVDAFLKRKFAELDAEPESKNLAGLNEIRKGEFQEGASLLKAAVALVVNSLYYIESVGSDSHTSPGRDVPPEQLAKWHQAPADRKFKASQKITRDGYVMVHLLQDPAMHSDGSALARREGVSTHWRRGHWRKQRHGPQNALLKRVWIRPVMVNPGQGDDERPGHVYVVPGGTQKH